MNGLKYNQSLGDGTAHSHHHQDNDIEFQELKDENLLQIVKSYTSYIALLVLCLLLFSIVTLHHSKQVCLGLIVVTVITLNVQR